MRKIPSVFDARAFDRSSIIILDKGEQLGESPAEQFLAISSGRNVKTTSFALPITVFTQKSRSSWFEARIYDYGNTLCLTCFSEYYNET